MGQRVTTFVQSFTGGEIGPEGWERTDLVQHARGCAEALNMIVLLTGPAASRGGFWDRGAIGVEAEPARFVPFRRSVEDALFVELGDEYGRVWTVSGDPVLDGPDPYEFPTPWTAAELDQLWFCQVGDVIEVTRRDGGRTQVIKRLGATDWAVAEVDHREGPWQAENTSTGIQLTATTGSLNPGATGTLAGLAPFSAADVGTLIRLRQGDGAAPYNTWLAKTAYSSGDLVTFDGKVYACQTGGTSGTNPPVHSSGVTSDGGVNWVFRHDGAGIVRVTGYTGAALVSITVVSRLPDNAATHYWSRQAYSDALGWPRALAAEREDRLAFGATLAQPSRLDFTRVAGFSPAHTDFKPGLGTGRVVDDDAVSLSIGGAGARIVWLASGAFFVVGTTEGEYIVTGPTLDDPIVPNIPISREISSYGSADVAPLKLHGPPPVLVHVDRTRKVLRELILSPDQVANGRELSMLASHIFGRGVAEMVMQRPENIVWFRLDDGGLASMTYHLEHQVLAPTTQGLPEGWTCESLASAPGIDGRDQVMGVFTRTKGETVQRRAWLLSRREDGMFMDGAARYEGEPVDAVAMDPAFEGETLTVVTDGALLGPRAVTDAEIGDLGGASEVVVGYGMTRRFESLPGDMQGVGSTLARRTRALEADVVLDCVEAVVKSVDASSQTTVRTRNADDIVAPGLRRARQNVKLGGGVDRDSRIEVTATGPWDLVIHAIRWTAEAET